MLESNDEMHRVVAHFTRALSWLEIKGADTTVAAPFGIKFWIQIEDAFALQIDDAQVGITGTLHFALGGKRKIAPQIGVTAEQIAKSVFEMAADFVDSIDSLDRATGRI